MTLLERGRELTELDAAIGEVVSGAGRLVAIEAKAGLGKTRLLQVACEGAEQAGLHVLTARATELERDFSFALVRQLFESELRTLPEVEREVLFDGAGAARGALGLEADGGHEYDDFAVLHGLYWLTAAFSERGPLLLAVDDAHWADPASLDYLGFMLPRLEELPVLVVVTSRPGEPNPPIGLGRVMTDTLARRVTPGPLSREAAAELLATELGRRLDRPFAEACYEVSGGNPFLLCELARTLVAQEIEPCAEQAVLVRDLAPEGVVRTMLMRVARLGSEAGAVARALAVLGDDSDRRLVAELAGLEPEAVVRGADALRASAILDPGASLRFIHPLVRNAVYAEVPAGARSNAHARAATLLLERDAGPERIATQLVATEARGEQETVELLLDAGRQALATGAPHSAIAYLTRALREPPPRDLRADVFDLLITAGVRAADYSMLATIEADVFAELERDHSLRSRWAIQLTLWMAVTGRVEQGPSILRQAIEVAVAEDDIERAFQLEAQLSTIAQLTPGVSHGQLERYAGQFEPRSPSGRLAAAIESLSAVGSGSGSEAADAARRALGDDGAIFAEDAPILAMAAVLTLVSTDDLDSAQHGATLALAIARRRGAATETANAWLLNAIVAWARGDLAVAEADAGQAVELARLAGVVPILLMAQGPLMQILIESDELEAAETELQATGMAGGAIPDNIMFSPLLAARGRLRLEQGRFEQAAEDLIAQSDRAESMGVSVGLGTMASPYAVRALIAIGERERARELAEGMHADAKRWGAPSMVAHALRALSVTTGGSAGVELLREAAVALEGSSRRLERTHTLSELGVALRREGHDVDARVPLREALELARRCGAVRLAKRTYEELRATGERVRRYTPIGVESLTPSERRVAELAASGLTNRQIAQSLFLTLKTIEGHLSASYDKLGIRSRQQLATALSRPGPGADSAASIP